MNAVGIGSRTGRGMLRAWTKGSGRRRLPIGAGQFSVIQFAAVVIILGTLCNLVMGSLRWPVAQARETALAVTLRNLRIQLAMYRVQHGGDLPPTGKVAQLLTGRSDAAGNMGTGDGYPLGPYFSELPQNPVNGKTSFKVVVPGEPVVADDSSGWLYCAENGRIYANCARTDRAGRLLAAY